MSRLTVVGVQVCVAVCVAVYMMLFLATVKEHKPLQLNPRLVRRFLELRGRGVPMVMVGGHLLGRRDGGEDLQQDQEDVDEDEDNTGIDAAHVTVEKGEEATDDEESGQLARLLTTLPPDIPTLPPTTFIPDQPDTSPLGKPPDIPKRFLIEEADFCQRRPGLQIIAYVHSAISRVKQRNITRTTWANASAYDVGPISVNIGVVFMVGRAKDEQEQRIVNEESQRYHDIVQGDYGEHYRLLTYKGLAGLYWISRHCSHVPWTLHSDDDTNIDIFLYHHALHELDQEAREKFVCSYMYGSVLRTGRWKVRYEEFANKSYPLYCSGGVWFLQTKLVPKLLEASKSVPFLWVDDAYITGFLAHKAGIKHHPFQKYYGGPKLKLDRLGHEVVWFVKFAPRWVWWDLIVQYHRNNSMHHPVTLLPYKTEQSKKS